MGGFSGPMVWNEDWDPRYPRSKYPYGAPPEPAPGGGSDLPGVSIPTPAEAARPLATSSLPSIKSPQRSADEAELQRMESSGSGIQQVQQKHGVAGGFLRGLDILGSALAPGITAAIPGTSLHHNFEVTGQRHKIAQDTTDEEKTAQAQESQAHAYSLLHPADQTGKTPEEVTIHDLLTGNNGGPRLNPQTKMPFTYLEAYGAVKQAAQDTKADNAGKTITTDKGIMQWNPASSRYDIAAGGNPKPEKPDNPEQQFIDAYMQHHKGSTVEQAIGAYGSATQKPQQPQQELAVGPDNKVIELKPGMTVQPGTKKASEWGKVPPDEQRRADLAGNLKENLDALEGILERRPELFGPMGGRFTGLKQTIGTNDPDIAALETIKHQMGMAQISAHGMRSAHGIEGAATSIVNGFHNSPEAMKGAINAARASVSTFEQDVENSRAGTPSPRQAPAGKGPTPGSVEQGYRFKGGNPADPNSWEKVQ